MDYGEFVDTILELKHGDVNSGLVQLKGQCNQIKRALLGACEQITSLISKDAGTASQPSPHQSPCQVASALEKSSERPEPEAVHLATPPAQECSPVLDSQTWDSQTWAEEGCSQEAPDRAMHRAKHKALQAKCERELQLAGSLMKMKTAVASDIQMALNKLDSFMDELRHSLICQEFQGHVMMSEPFDVQTIPACPDGATVEIPFPCSDSARPFASSCPSRSSSPPPCPVPDTLRPKWTDPNLAISKCKTQMLRAYSIEPASNGVLRLPLTPKAVSEPEPDGVSLQHPGTSRSLPVLQSTLQTTALCS